MHKQLFIFLFLATVTNLSAVENKDFNLAEKVQQLITSAEAKKCFEKAEHKKLFSIFISNYKENPEAFNTLPGIKVMPNAEPFLKKIIELINENIEWSTLKAFKLDFLKMKITALKNSESFDAYELRKLNSLFEAKHKQKIESANNQDIKTTTNTAIQEAINAIKYLLDY